MAINHRKINMALKVSGCVVMFVVFILTARTYYLADKTIMSTAIVFQIAIGIVALLGLTVLCLVHTLESNKFNKLVSFYSL